jgi:DNA-binding PadR family transcriptional regulator
VDDDVEAGDGFELPNYTQIPNVLFDELLVQLRPTTIVVLLFLLRRTLGFHKAADAIALSQIAAGTAISKPTVITCLRDLETRGLIQSRKETSEDRGYETTVYSVRFRDTPWLKDLTSPSKNLTSPPRKASLRTKEGGLKKDMGVGKKAGAVDWARRHGLTGQD